MWRLLLADVSEKFRNDSLKNYGLCLSHYLSEKALSWDAILNMTKIKLDLISDPDMYIFLEKGKRGGVSYISNRYSKTNINVGHWPKTRIKTYYILRHK